MDGGVPLGVGVSSRSLYAERIEKTLRDYSLFTDSVSLQPTNDFFINSITNVSENLGMKKC